MKPIEFKDETPVVVVRFTQDVIIPNGFASEAHMNEWLRHWFGGNPESKLDEKNPLAAYSPTVMAGTLDWRAIFSGHFGEIGKEKEAHKGKKR